MNLTRFATFPGNRISLMAVMLAVMGGTVVFLACAKPKYLPQDEIVEVAVSYLEQAQTALRQAEEIQAAYNYHAGRSRDFADLGDEAGSARENAEAQRAKHAAIQRFALALEQLRISERTNVRPRTFFLFGQLYVDLGDYDRSLAYFDLGLSLSPDFEPARRARIQVSNLKRGVETGLAEISVNWVEEVEALVAQGPVLEEDQLSPPVIEEPSVAPTRRPTSTAVPTQPDDGTRPKLIIPGPTPTPAEGVKPIPGQPLTPPDETAPGEAPVPVETPETPSEAPEAPDETPSQPVETPAEPVPSQPLPPMTPNADFQEGTRLLAEARSAERTDVPERAQELYAQAVQALSNAKSDPAIANDPRLRYNLGNAHLGAGNLDEAIAEYQATVSIEPGNAKAYNNLGLAYARAGYTSSAIDAFENSARIGGVPDAHYNAGMLLIKRNDIDQAIKHLEAYVAVDPNSPFGLEASRQLVLLRRRL